MIFRTRDEEEELAFDGGSEGGREPDREVLKEAVAGQHPGMDWMNISGVQEECNV